MGPLPARHSPLSLVPVQGLVPLQGAPKQVELLHREAEAAPPTLHLAQGCTPSESPIQSLARVPQEGEAEPFKNYF